MGRDEKNDTTKSGVSDGIAREERDGLTFMLWGRLIVLAALALWVTLTVPIERSGTYLLVIAAFAIIGVAPYILTRWELGGARVTALFLLLDIGVLCYILLVPAPFSVEGWTPQLNLRLPNILFLGIFLVGMALSYSPFLVYGRAFPRSSSGALAIYGLQAWSRPRPSHTRPVICSMATSPRRKRSASFWIRTRSA
jgi:hypothetical protein